MTDYIIRRQLIGDKDASFTFCGVATWQSRQEDAKRFRYEVAMAKLIELDLVSPTYTHEMVAICSQVTVQPTVQAKTQEALRPVHWEMVLAC